MKNVIKFPLERRLDQIAWQKIEAEWANTARDDKQIAIEEVVDALVAEFIFMMIEDFGINADDERYIYDVSFFYETIKSLVSKFNGVTHPIQQLADNIYRSHIETYEAAQYQLEFSFDD